MNNKCVHFLLRNEGRESTYGLTCWCSEARELLCGLRPHAEDGGQQCSADCSVTTITKRTSRPLYEGEQTAVSSVIITCPRSNVTKASIFTHVGYFTLSLNLCFTSIGPQIEESSHGHWCQELRHDVREGDGGGGGGVCEVLPPLHHHAGHGAGGGPPAQTPAWLLHCKTPLLLLDPHQWRHDGSRQH